MDIQARIEELKKLIADTNESLKDKAILDDEELVKLLKEELQKAEEELGKLTTEAEKAVATAQDNLKNAKKGGDKSEVKEAKEELNNAKKNEKVVDSLSDKIESAGDKVEKVEEKIKKHGGKRVGAGRKKDPNKPVKVKGQRGGKRVGAGRKPKKMKKPVVSKSKSRMLMKPSKAKAVAKGKEKSVKAFGQTVTFKNDAEFCEKLIKAFKKRRSVYKKSNKRTKPVFAVITAGTANIVKKAMNNVSVADIKKNPKQMITKFQRLESKAIDFLNAFKDILGSDFKKSEISKEFGDVEAAIKNLIKKYKD